MSLTAYKKNKAIEKMVLEKDSKSEPYSQDELAFVNSYIGYGGMWKYDTNLSKERGLYEYYTRIEIVEKMIGLAHKYGYDGGAVLEPSCGIGRFLHYFNPKSDITGIEPDKISYLIAKANFPSFEIQNRTFNDLFIDRRGKSKYFRNDYHLLIGNPPYGTFSGRGTVGEKRTTKANTYVDYFITRGLDVLRPEGLLVFIIPSAFLDGSETEVKSEVLKKATLLDAYRLPKAVFDQTDIQTDIVVFQKK
jgi:type I restriction-modification system DNA methylase subunit